MKIHLDLNNCQVEAALQILFLLLGAPIVLQGFPILNPGHNPSIPIPSSRAPTHQIFRSPLKIQPGSIVSQTENQELTTPPSILTGNLFHSNPTVKRKEEGGIATNGNKKVTVVETNLLPCFPLSTLPLRGTGCGKRTQD